MKIIFNLLNTGFGNNGGSLNLIKSANMLQELGHDVKVVDSGKNQNTWYPLNVEHIVIKGIKSCLLGDVIIATGIKSVDSTNKSNIKLKVHWIRGWETWNYLEEKLVKILKESPTIKVVNSLCLWNKLNQLDIECHIIRPGYDFEDYFPMSIRTPKRIVIGGLYNEGSKRKTKRTQWIFECFKRLKEKFSNLELFMYGSDGFSDNNYITSFYRNPTVLQKNFIYNTVDVWLAPSENEGLANPPAEAMLTGAVPVTTNCEMSGTQDYITHNETGIVSENDLDSFIFEVEQLVRDPEKRKRLAEKGREKILSLGDRTINMKRMVKLLETLKGE